MTHKATIVELPATTLIVYRAEQDREPEIKAAWQTLESKLTSLKGRKFYGLCYADASGTAYYAGVEPRDVEEVITIGLPTMAFTGGKYARVKLLDWPKHTDRISAIVEELERTFRADPARPVVEHYRSHSELHVLVPIAEE